MPLQATHPLTVASGDYKDQLLAELRITEGFNNGKPYIDVVPSPAIATIGYGFNIETISAYMALTLNQMGILGNKTAAETQQILGQFIVAATAATGPTTAAATSDLQARLNSLVPQYGVSEFKLSEPQAKTIYNQILEGATIGVTDGSPLVIPGKQPHLDAILGNALAHNTLEYVALMSMFYNTESLVAAGSKLATAVINDDRAEAWYQIRYNSNADGQHTARRIDESKLFSLYDNPGQGVSEGEAKEVLRMYTIHQKEIQDYESRFATLFPTDGTNTVMFQIIGAKTTLIPIYNAGKAIDGEVLVGNEFSDILDEYGRLVLDKNDLLFGEGGNDYLYVQAGHSGMDATDAQNRGAFMLGGLGADSLTGGTGADLLVGNTGFDSLAGGAGADTLLGGQGLDRYYWNTGDGYDRIEDADATGAIFVNGQMLVGGIKKAGHTDWTSPDGTIKYEMSGTDLVVRLNGTQVMTVNENFQSGQFGVRLLDCFGQGDARRAMERMAA